MEPASLKKLSICSWNVRGLNDTDKCRDVRFNLKDHRLHVICLQETKLTDISASKAASFLPPGFSSFQYKSSDGASGGLINAWPRHHLELNHSLTSFFESTVDNLTFAVSNVYGPCTNELRPEFLNELRHLATVCSNQLWLIFGDFNLTREPGDQNNNNFSAQSAEAFNEIIDELLLHELLLLDRRYTWSNCRNNPTLVHLDRALINTQWGQTLFNSSLTSLVRNTSDHIPLLLTATSTAPVSQVFRYEQF